MKKTGIIFLLLFVSMLLFSQKNRVKIENGKQGLTDPNGKILIPCKYDYIQDLSRISTIELAIVTRNQKSGLVTYKNEIIQPLVYDSYYIGGLSSSPMIYLEKDSKWGAFKANGDVFLPVEYDYIGESNSRYNTCIRKGEKWGLIDSLGWELIPYKYDELDYVTDDLLCANVEDKVGLIDEKNDVIIPIKYKSIASTEIDNLFIARKEGVFNYCLLDIEGKEILNLSDDKIELFRDDLFIVKKNGFQGIINTKGEIIVPFIYNSIDHVYGNIARVKDKKGKYGFINGNGKLVAPFVYDNVDFFSNKVHFVKKGAKGGFLDSNTAKEITLFEYDSREYSSSAKVFILSKNDKFGILDMELKVIIPFEYQHLQLVDDNAIIAKKDNKWGMLQATGELLIPFGYDELRKIGGPLNLDSYILCKKNNKYGILNTEGKEITAPIYDEMSSTFAHTLIVGKNGKYGLIDRYGNTLSPIVFDKIRENDIAELTATKNGKQGIISVTSGKEIQPCIYDSISFVFDKFNLTILNCIVQKNGKWGIYAGDFSESVPCMYDSISILEKNHKTYLLEKQGKYGLINDNGLTVIDFDSVKLMQTDSEAAYFHVTRKDKEGVVSSTELKEIIPCQYDKIPLPKNPGHLFYIDANKDGHEYKYRCVWGAAELMETDE